MRPPARAKLFTLYVHELFSLATAVVNNCDSIFAETNPPTAGHFIKVDPTIHARINSVLTDAANIKKLIQTAETKRKGENAAVFAMRRYRSEVLTQLLKGVELSELLNTKVRNTVEHFADYLDEANVELAETPPDTPFAAYNMTLSGWGIMHPPPFPVRIYIADEKRFHNLKYSIDLGLVRNEAQGIRDRLLSVPPLKDAPEPGGLMIGIEDPAQAAGKPPIEIHRRRK